MLHNIALSTFRKWGAEQNRFHVASNGSQMKWRITPQGLTINHDRPEQLSNLQITTIAPGRIIANDENRAKTQTSYRLIDGVYVKPLFRPEHASEYPAG